MKKIIAISLSLLTVGLPAAAMDSIVVPEICINGVPLKPTASSEEPVKTVNTTQAIAVPTTLTVAYLGENGDLAFFAGKTTEEKRKNASMVLKWFKAQKTLNELLEEKNVNTLFAGGLIETQHTITKHIWKKGSTGKYTSERKFTITMHGTKASVNALKFAYKYYPNQHGFNPFIENYFYN